MHMIRVAAIITCVASTLGAQPARGRITGTIWDSTAGAPLAGALVLARPLGRPDLAGRSVDADSIGRFALEDLGVGRWVVTFVHRAADEYGVSPLPAALDVVEGRETTAAFFLPIPRVLRGAACGRQPSDTLAAVVGSVRDETTGRWLRGASVLVSWRTFDMRAMRLRPRWVRTTTTDDGTFRVCGLPFFEPIRVQAGLQATQVDSLASGEIDVTVERGGITRVHVGVGRVTFAPSRPDADGPTLGGTARAEGTVVDANARPLAGARILVLGAGRETISSPDGTFRLDSLPVGSRTLEARAIGQSPARTSVLLRPDATTTASLAFRPPAPSVDRVLVFGRRKWNAHLMDEFIRRRETGSGYFLTAEDVEQSRATTLTQLLSRAPNVRTLAGRGGRMVLRGRGNCRPDVYVNGTRAEAGADELDVLLPPEEVLAIETHDGLSGNPPAFATNAQGCVVVAIWTK